MELTLGTDDSQAKDEEPIPLFRVIPATPVNQLDEQSPANAQTSKTRPLSQGEQAYTDFKAKPRVLEDAVELENRAPPPAIKSSSTIACLPETRPLVIKALQASGAADAESLPRDMDANETTPPIPSLTSMSTVSSQPSLAEVESDQQPYLPQGVLTHFAVSQLEDLSTNPYDHHDDGCDTSDPLRFVKDQIDAELRSWSSSSLTSVDMLDEHGQEGHELPDDQGRHDWSVSGLGFEIQGDDGDDRAATPTGGHVQPLVPTEPVRPLLWNKTPSHHHDYQSPTKLPSPATMTPRAAGEEETTPRPDRFSTEGFPSSTVPAPRRPSSQTEQQEQQDRRISSTSSALDSDMDTDLDSLMSDIDDLQSASITMVASKTISATFVSPRKVDLDETCSGSVAPGIEELISLSQDEKVDSGEPDDPAARWENADEDEYEVAWAM